jgi:hypothetical protein
VNDKRHTWLQRGCTVLHATRQWVPAIGSWLFLRQKRLWLAAAQPLCRPSC